MKRRALPMEKGVEEGGREWREGGGGREGVEGGRWKREGGGRGRGVVEREVEGWRWRREVEERGGGGRRWTFQMSINVYVF